MNPVLVTFRRTLALARCQLTTALVVAAFLAAVALRLTFDLDAAEGGAFSLAALWAGSVAPFLPVLAALLAMDVWSEERRTGRMDLLLSTAVRERDLVLGKFLGVCVMTLVVTALSGVSSLMLLTFFSPNVLTGLRVLSVLLAFFALALQGALWCAASVALSTLFTRASASACAALSLLVALPRGLWAGLMLWSPAGRTAFGEMPLDAHVSDLASGVFSSGIVLTYLILIVLALFIASKAVSYLRLVGHGGRGRRLSTLFALVLAVAASAATSALALRLDVVLDASVEATAGFSPRLRHILAESSGSVAITGFLPRSDAAFRSTGRLLRALKREADVLGGLKVNLRFVDPRWDVGPAARLVGLGAPENSVVFEKGRRTAVLPLKDGFDESLVASVLQRIAMPPLRRDVYWTCGHGESRFDAYDNWGMSDIARELAREGYSNRALDLAGDAPVPADCALIVVAGAKDDFSRAELGRLDAYLRAGGRLLVLMGAPGQGGVSSLLPAWGIRPVVQPLVGVPTRSGSDVIVSDFAEHPISTRLDGLRIVLEKPVSFTSSAVAESGTGADRVEFSSIARIGTSALVAAVERGAGAGSDLSIRPTRIVAIGDSTFAMNGQLAARANANRDFFLNAVAFLSGTDATGASGVPADVLVVNLDRASRARFVLVSSLAVPGGVFLLLLVVALRRRWRK